MKVGPAKADWDFTTFMGGLRSLRHMLQCSKNKLAENGATTAQRTVANMVQSFINDTTISVDDAATAKACEQLQLHAAALPESHANRAAMLLAADLAATLIKSGD